MLSETILSSVSRRLMLMFFTCSALMLSALPPVPQWGEVDRFTEQISGDENSCWLKKLRNKILEECFHSISEESLCLIWTVYVFLNVSSSLRSFQNTISSSAVYCFLNSPHMTLFIRLSFSLSLSFSVFTSLSGCGLHLQTPFLSTRLISFCHLLRPFSHHSAPPSLLGVSFIMYRLCSLHRVSAVQNGSGKLWGLSERAANGKRSRIKAPSLYTWSMTLYVTALVKKLQPAARTQWSTHTHTHAGTHLCVYVCCSKNAVASQCWANFCFLKLCWTNHCYFMLCTCSGIGTGLTLHTHTHTHPVQLPWEPTSGYE